MAHDHSPGFMPPPAQDTPATAPLDETTPDGPQHIDTVRTGKTTGSRVGMVWTMLGVGLVLLAAILVFITQNGRKADVHFLMFHGQLPLGVALLFAALLGGLLVLAVGATRIVQLRRASR